MKQLILLALLAGPIRIVETTGFLPAHHIDRR